MKITELLFGRKRYAGTPQEALRYRSLSDAFMTVIDVRERIG